MTVDQGMKFIITIGLVPLGEFDVQKLVSQHAPEGRS
jgi:hypothetical protein